MTLIDRVIIIGLLPCLILSCTSIRTGDRVEELVSPSHENLIYSGRIDFSNHKAPEFFWAGTSVCLSFEGRLLRVVLDDEGENYYKAIIDGSETVDFVCQKGEHMYTLATELEDTIHTVQLIRRTDCTLPKSIFKGFLIEEGKGVLPLNLTHDMKIEFYGNSITSAHGVLDESRNNNDDFSTWDSYYSYAALTARALNAEYRSISRSGIGIIKSWYPLTMPEMYDRLDPSKEGSTWEFSKWTPDVVVVNLFQNDSWLIDEIAPKPTDEEIKTAYSSFVGKLRSAYPQSIVICTLGNMDATKPGSKWPDYVKESVLQMTKNGDSKLHSLIFPYKNSAGHPTIPEQQAMAEMLIAKIKEVTK